MPAFGIKAPTLLGGYTEAALISIPLSRNVGLGSKRAASTEEWGGRQLQTEQGPQAEGRLAREMPADPPPTH